MRKLRERGLAEDADGRAVEVDIAGLVEQFVERGYVDDDAYARSKSRDLTARGYGARRVEQALWVAGVDEQVRSDHAPGDAERRRAALVMARKRRFGPYHADQAAAALGRKTLEKQIAAMLRAGHDFDMVRFIIHSVSVDEVEQWLAEAEAEESADEEQSTW